ncbi:hydrogenase maturation nickel metallochaperone HypA [archaeon]
MHEIEAAQSLLKAALAVAEASHAKKVRKVYAVVGELAFLPDENLRLNFEAAAKGTIAEGAELVIEKKKAHYSCACGAEGELPRVEGDEHHPVFFCPKCGEAVDLESGREHFAKSVDLDV